MAKVVMLTAMAGAGLTLVYGDVYETDDVEAARFLEHQAAREFDEKLDGQKPVIKKPTEVDPDLPEGHFQQSPSKGKGKRKRTDNQVDNQVDNQLDNQVDGLQAESNATESSEGEPNEEPAGESEPEPKPTRRRR